MSHGFSDYDRWKSTPPEDLEDTDPSDDEVEVCDHGVGFDEDCEWCDLDNEEERRMRRHANDPQQDWIGFQSLPS